VRLAGSSGANPFACIAAGIACLWGPAHGGANEAALNMLREIGSVSRIPEYVRRAKDKDDPFRLHQILQENLSWRGSRHPWLGMRATRRSGSEATSRRGAAGAGSVEVTRSS
jgi:hypothetical protein